MPFRAIVRPMNIAMLGERHLERFGAYEAVIFRDTRLTNEAILDAGARFASTLRDLGVTPGDRVAVMIANMPEVASTYGAILRSGGVVVPILFLLAVPEVTHIFADCQPKVVVTSPEFLPNILAAREGSPNPPTVVVVGGEAGEHLAWATAIDRTDRTSMVERDPSDLAVVSYTSGTTGRPKGVMLTHGNLAFNAENTRQVVPSRDGDVTMLMLPLAHLFGISSMLVQQSFKTTSVILPWFIPDDVLDAVDRYGVTGTAAVPTMLTLLLAHPRFDEIDWTPLRWIVVSAAPVPQELAAEFERRTGSRVLEAYGQTEASPTISIMRIDQPRRPGSCGQVVPDVEVEIRDDDGVVLAAGQSGEICARGPNIMAGYYGLPDATADTVRDGWLLTGDIGHLDDDGYLYITERKKDLIIRAGFNIYPRDVEEVLYEHPAVMEASVVGAPHPTLGEEVVAFVVLRSDAEATDLELLEFCRARLAKYKSPSRVLFTDVLPKNAIGKVLKRDLREMVPVGTARE